MPSTNEILARNAESYEKTDQPPKARTVTDALADLQQFVNDWSGECEDSEGREVSKRAVAALATIRATLSPAPLEALRELLGGGGTAQMPLSAQTYLIQTRLTLLRCSMLPDLRRAPPSPPARERWRG